MRIEEMYVHLLKENIKSLSVIIWFKPIILCALTQKEASLLLTLFIFGIWSETIPSSIVSWTVGIDLFQTELQYEKPLAMLSSAVDHRVVQQEN